MKERKAKAPRGLTDLEIRNVPLSGKRYEKTDAKTLGLRLVVQPSGSKSWAFRYRFEGEPAKLTLGSYPAMGLAEARAAVDIARGELAKGIDPAAARREEREAARIHAITWREALARYLASKVEGRLRSAKEVKRSLERECAGWNNTPVDDLKRADVFRVLDALEARNAPVMANRLLSRLNAAFKWMMIRELIQTNPCAGVPRIKEKIDDEDESDKRVLNDHELALVWRASEHMRFPHGHIIRLLILTGARRSEVADARWDEFDFVKNVWRIPAARAKNKKSHEVPLSPLALEIIKAIPRFATGLLFSSSGKVPNDFSAIKRRLDREVARLNGGEPIEHFVLHDIRRSVATGFQALGVAMHVTEKALNHRSGSFRGIVGVYQRHNYAAEVRAAFERWALHIERVVAGDDGESNVVELRAAQ